MAVEMPGRPAYQQIADSLRNDIASGRLPVGQAVGSTVQLMQQYGVSSTVVRKAVEQLRAEGLVVGHPGKGVFVRATPAETAEESATLAGVAADLAEVRKEIAALAGEARDSKVEVLSQSVTELKRQVASLQAHLVELYARVGQPYPHNVAAEEHALGSRARRA